MDRWTGRVALVTGASAGIGAAIAVELARQGLKVVGAARRVEKILALKKDLKGARGEIYPIKCDVTKEEDILAVFAWIKKNLGGVDVLVNNAGIASADSLLDGKTSGWREVFDINVHALNICTREAYKSMQERGVDDGHIININSICGHKVTNYPCVAPYCASKYAVTAITEGLRRELKDKKSHIRVTSLSPGTVKTEIFDLHPEGEVHLRNNPYILPEDIAEAVVYILSTKPRVQIHELLIQANGEGF